MNDELLSKIRIEDFIKTYKLSENENISILKKYAKENDVPIIRDSAIDMLRMILNIKKPKNILEIGTAIGFSAMVMKYELVDVHIDTIEDFETRIEEAKKTFEKYDKENNITLYEGDAFIYLNKWVAEGKKDIYDFIFLDAAKAQYINWLPDILTLLKKDGVLYSDNVFKDDEIIQNRWSIEKRDRTIHKRMREYLYEITHNEDLKSYIFDIADGVAMSIKCK